MPRTLTRLPALALTLALALGAFGTTAAHATAYTFTETYDNGATRGGADTVVTVTGSFDGTASGNLITGLSNFTLLFNGLAVDPGTLFIRAYNGGGFYDTNAVLSFDGLQNNLVLTNSSDPATQPPTTGINSMTALGNGNVDTGFSVELVGTNNDPTTTILLISEATAVPEPASLTLLALGCAGLAAARRRGRG